jgi:hypothetical protein
MMGMARGGDHLRPDELVATQALETGESQLMRVRSCQLLAVAVLLLVAFPAAASAKFEVGLNHGGYAISTTAVKEYGRYPGARAPGTYHFEYMPYSFTFDRNCPDLDWSGAQRTPDRHILSLDEVVVSETIEGLTPGHGGDPYNSSADPASGYCIRFVAQLDDGSASDHTPGDFVIPGAPTIGLLGSDFRPRASGPSQITATADLNAAGQTTDYTVSAVAQGQPGCGPTQSFHYAIEARGTLRGTDGEFHAITETLTAPFTRGQGYSVCMVANNATKGATAIALPFKFGQPFVSYDGTTSNITTTSATLSVQASGSGAASPARFQVRSQKSCFSGGRTLNADPLPADYSLHTLKVNVTGLEPNTDYCWVARATNDVGSAGSDDNYGAVEFKTLPTPADSVSAPSSAGSVAPTPSGAITLIQVVAGCGRAPCTYTSTATATGASSAGAAAAKAKRVVVATGKLKLKTGRQSPIKLKLTPTGKRLLKRNKTLAVTVVVNGKDGAGRKSSKTVKAKFKAL